MRIFNEEEVKNMLVSTLLVCQANNNQGSNAIKGKNFGEKAQNIINVYDKNKSADNSILKTVSSLGM